MSGFKRLIRARDAGPYPVSYTHLTLPTILRVWISVVAVPLTKNNEQSPTSTVNPNAVNVDTPRRHPSRVPIADQAGSAAILTIALSRRSRRSADSSTV